MDKEVVIIEEEPKKAPSRSRIKTRECRVIRYTPSTGVLGFDFDGTPCQIKIGKNLNIGRTYIVKYEGSIQTGIKFKVQA